MRDELLGGRYRYERVIGRGAMGEVWLGHDELLDRRVAIKTVTDGSALAGLADTARDDQLRRMMREARLAARLNHRSAVAVYDLVMVGDRPNVVMEYVEGRTLSDEIRAVGTLAPERVAEVGAAIADALAEAHEFGIVHRDIKPSNILVTRRGRPKLADFGIAKIAGDAGITSTGIMIGTPAFVAPEVARGQVADAASDVWSLGATLYAALEGHSPFQRDSVEDLVVVLGRLVTQQVPPLSRPGPVSDVVMSMLRTDPAARPRADAVARRLRTLADTVGATVLAPSQPDAPAAAADELAVAATPSTPLPGADRWTAPTELRNLLDAPTGPPGGGGDTRSSRTQLVVAAVAVLVAASALVAVLLVRSRGAGSPSSADAGAQGSATRSATRSATTGAASQAPSTGSSIGFAESTSPGSSPGSAVAGSTPLPSIVSTPTSLYSAPGGITVRAPAGWTRDDFFHVARTSEFVDGADHFADAYIHLGIGNATTLPDWNSEVSGAVSTLKHNAQYTAVEVQPPVAVTFRGTDNAADIEFTETNSNGIPRHAIERIWSERGSTYIVQLNTPASEWTRLRPVFTTMTQTCSVTG